MVSFSSYAKTVFILVVCLTAQAEDQLCPKITDPELAKLKMGSYSHPAADVTKTQAGGADPGVDFTRKMGDGKVPQELLIQHFLSSEIRVDETEPTANSDRYQEKEILLDLNCKIERIDLTITGTGIPLTAKVCQSLEKNSVQQMAESLNYHPLWVKDAALSDVAKKTCAEYKGQFITDDGTPYITPGNEPQSDSAVKK